MDHCFPNLAPVLPVSLTCAFLFALLSRRLPSSRPDRPHLLGLLPATNRNDVRRLGSNSGQRFQRRNLARLLVRESLALVVPENHLVIIDLLDVLGKERNLPTTTRRIDDEMRNGETGRPAAQRLNYLESLLHVRPEVLTTRNLVGHVDVVRT